MIAKAKLTTTTLFGENVHGEFERIAIGYYSYFRKLRSLRKVSGKHVQGKPQSSSTTKATY